MKMNTTDFSSMNRTSKEEFCKGVLSSTESPPPSLSKDTRIIITVLLSVVVVLGIVGNVLVILAVRMSSRTLSLTLVFIISLATADLGVAVLVMPFDIYRQYNDGVWELGENVCLVVSSLDIMLCTSSIYHLCCLAFDRYLTICLPFVRLHMSEMGMEALLVIVWVVPAVLSFGPLFQKWNIIGIEDMVDCIKFFSDNKACMLLVNKEFALIGSSISFFIPIVFMAVMNWKIYRTAIIHIERIKKIDRNPLYLRDTQAAKTLGIIMLCISVCWFPFFICNVIDPLTGYGISGEVWSTVLWLGYINSVINPFLYYAFNRSLRSSFHRMLPECCGCREQKPKRSSSLTVTASVSSQSQFPSRVLPGHLEHFQKAMKTKESASVITLHSNVSFHNVTPQVDDSEAPANSAELRVPPLRGSHPSNK